MVVSLWLYEKLYLKKKEQDFTSMPNLNALLGLEWRVWMEMQIHVMPNT